MKAIIDAADNGYIIRLYGKKSALCDIHVVDEIEISGEYLKTMTEFNGNIPETACLKGE